MRRIHGVVILVAVTLFTTAGWSQENAGAASGASAAAATQGEGLWLAVSVESPAVNETIQVEMPLAAISKLVKALPEKVKQDLEEKKIPYDLIEVAAESFGDYEPLTIFDRKDDATQDHFQIRTKEREGQGSGKVSHYLKGVLVYPDTEEKKGSRTEFTLPLTAVERIGKQLEEFKLPVKLLGDSEDMKAAIEAFVSVLRVSPPGDLVVVKTAGQDVHVWIE